MLSNSYNANAYAAMPTAPTLATADTASNFSGNIPASNGSFQGSSAPKKVGAGGDEKKGKDWVPHWVASALSFVGWIPVSMGIDALLAGTKNPKTKLAASCIGGALTGLGFEWFRQENNEGKISPGNLAMNTVMGGLPLGHIWAKISGKSAAKEGGEAATATVSQQAGK